MKYYLNVKIFLLTSFITFACAMENECLLENKTDKKEQAVLQSCPLGPLYFCTKKYANKNQCVLTEKKDLLPFIVGLIKKLEQKVKEKNLLTNVWDKEVLENLRILQKRFDDTNGPIVSISPYEIEHLMVKELHYIPKNNLGRTLFAKALQKRIFHPQFDLSESITISLDDYRKTLSGALGKCINGLRGLSTLERMGIAFNTQGFQINTWINGERNSLLFINNDPKLADTIGTILEMCHHPCLEAFEKELGIQKDLIKFEEKS